MNTGVIGVALIELERLISLGWEYPDAHAWVTIKYKVDADELATAYDAQFNQENGV